MRGQLADVLRVGTGWFSDVAGFAADAPSWLRSFAGFFTDAGVVLLYAVIALCWWRARRLPARSMAFALLGPIGVVAGYLASSVIKLLVAAERPCRALRTPTLIDCPPPGDWSFPSNHAALAGAAAVCITLAWRTVAVPVVAFALAVAASRVFVGVHYPHDVVAGLLIGGVAAALTVFALVRPATWLTIRLRDHPRLRPLVTSGSR
ncbi:MAG: phosphatase PAP2 family protein [Thermocrispum sp.]